MDLLSKISRAASRATVCLIGAWVWCAWPAAAQDRIIEREYQLKAAFLYNFAKFVEWPDDNFADASAPMVFCILGEDPFGGSLEAVVHDKNINGRGIIVHRAEKLSGLEICHVLFVSESWRGGLGDIFNALAESDILTVGDRDRFAHDGGMINMVRKRNKIRFQINQLAVTRTGLEMNYRLLTLAEIVK